MDDVPDGRGRPDVRPVQPFRQLCDGQDALRDRALHQRGEAAHRVLDQRLEDAHWLAGDEYSMADIITFPWIRKPPRRAAPARLPRSRQYPDVQRWHDAIAARPAVQRGRGGARRAAGAQGRSPTPSARSCSARRSSGRGEPARIKFIVIPGRCAAANPQSMNTGLLQAGELRCSWIPGSALGRPRNDTD